MLSSAPTPAGRWWTDALIALSTAGLLATLALGPAVAVLLHTGALSVPDASDLVSGWWRLVRDGRWSDPAGAFPAPLRRSMPPPELWWLSVGGVAVLIAAALFQAMRALDRLAAGAVLGRRPWSLRGSRPRSWARPRDVAQLRIRARTPARLTLGALQRSGTNVAAQEDAHLLLVAPTRAGKTSRFVVPWTLEAPGPCISLSVKTDVFRLTAGYRSNLGRVWLWDPFGPRSDGWSPLIGCERWSAALRRAAHLADAGGKGRESEAAAFWNAEGAKLLAPLLHAAALDGCGMSTVLRWLDERTDEQPMAILDAVEADAAAAQLEAVVGLDPRNAGTTFISAANLVEAYRHPEVQASESRADLTAAAFLDGAPNTVYIVAGADDQRLLAPVIVAMLGEILALAETRARDSGGALDPRLRVVGDELPNIAPLRALPRYLATLLDAGVRFVSVCQDLAQLEATYGTEKDTILSNSQAKVFLGPVTCPRTRQYIVDLLGDELVKTPAAIRRRDGAPSESVTWRPRASAQVLQQLDAQRALLVHGNAPAAVIYTRPWWEIPSVRRRCDVPFDPLSSKA